MRTTLFETGTAPVANRIGCMRTVLLCVMAAAAGFLAGQRLDALKPSLTATKTGLQHDSVSRQLAAWQAREQPRDSDESPVLCPEWSKRRAVLLTIGQSNAANSVGHRFAARSNSVEWSAGSCYRAAGPLVGAEGQGGSVWPLVADGLIDANSADAVVLLGAAKGGTSAAEWQTAAQSGGYLDRRLAQLVASNMAPTHVLWQQGEIDVATDPQVYLSQLRGVIDAVRRHAPGAKIFIAQSSYCWGHSSEGLLAAQRSLVEASAKVFAGPNTDTIIGDTDRYDGCHFSEQGARRVAAAWVAALTIADLRH